EPGEPRVLEGEQSDASAGARRVHVLPESRLRVAAWHAGAPARRARRVPGAHGRRPAHPQAERVHLAYLCAPAADLVDGILRSDVVGPDLPAVADPGLEVLRALGRHH